MENIGGEYCAAKEKERKFNFQVDILNMARIILSNASGSQPAIHPSSKGPQKRPTGPTRRQEERNFYGNPVLSAVLLMGRAQK